MKMLARYRPTRNSSKSYDAKCERFFRSRNGREITPDALTQLMNELGHTAGINLHPHLLRHTFATIFMANESADVLPYKQSVVGQHSRWLSGTVMRRCLKLQRSMMLTPGEK
jgi:site-specific recombinase XerD